MDTGTITEGKAKLLVPIISNNDPFHKLVFYNPLMEFNRTISSIAVGAAQPSTALDGLCATGARGIRYAVENTCVKKITFVDANLAAIPLLKKNIAANKITKRARVVGEELNHFLTTTGDASEEFGWLELDPFGAPVFFLDAALRKLMSQKRGILSVTSTDLAKLCGKERDTCIRHYSAFPLRCEFSHEIAVRIMLAAIVRRAAVFDCCITPLISFYQGHAIKVVLDVKPGALKATQAIESLKWLNYCPKCHTRTPQPLPDKKCASCKETTQPTGPLWVEPTSDGAFVEKMIAVNSERDYPGKEKIAEYLQKLLGENSLPPFYFDLHQVVDELGINAPKTELVMERLRAKGFAVTPTHYNPVGIRTDAGWKEVAECTKTMGKP